MVNSGKKHLKGLLDHLYTLHGKEIDFVIIEKLKPIMAIECKWEDGPVSKALSYFKLRFPACEMWQISAIGKQDYRSKEKIRVMPAVGFLADLV